MKIKKAKLLLTSLMCLTAALSVVLSGCGVFGSRQDDAAIVLRFGEVATVQSISVDWPVETIVNYIVTGTGPANQTVSLNVDATESQITISDLLPGEWLFEVEATNGSGELVLSGNSSTYLEAGVTSDVTITLSPLSGDGTITVIFNWSPGSIDSPSAFASLAPLSGGGPGVDEVLTEDGFDVANGTAAYGGTRPAGYYWLYTALVETSASPDSVPPWSSQNSVRVVAGYDTGVSVDLDTGAVTITISLDAQEPLTVAMSGVQNPLSSGTSMTVTASVVETGSYTYYWYLDGVLLPENPVIPEQTVIDGDTVGLHRLSVVVAGTDTLGSSWVAFNVIP
jgi:hypothetical protein